MVVARRRACALAVAMLLGLASQARADEPSLPQKIALTAKPAVVKVWGAYIAKFSLADQVFEEAIGGSGSGFFLTPDGYIATNAHVVADVHDGDDAAKKKLLTELYQDLDHKFHAQISRMSDEDLKRLVDQIQLVEFRKWAYIVLPNGDHLDYEIKQYGEPGTGRDCAIIKVATQNAPTLPIGDSTESQVEDHVVVIGYPGVADMKELLDDKSQLEPSVTDGAISALKKASSGEQIIQISAPITHGNSGGPAIDQHGNVVGLATFGNEGDVQGFNFLVASATLQKLIDAAKIKPQGGDTDKAWRAGLDHYWADEYTDAVAKFEEVETLFPQHSEAPKLILLSHQAQKEGKEKKPSSNTGLVVGITVGGVLALVVVLVLVLGRKKPPAIAARPGMPMPGMPMPGGPMPGAPMPGAPMPGYGAPQAPQMYGRAPAPAPGQPAMVPRTVAILPGGSTPGGIAPTAFGSLAIGSLQCTRGRLMGQRFALTATGIIVGRQPGVAHVLVDDQRASGKHVWIGIENGRLVAIDQGTTNGTYVNDIMRGRITRAELRDGDVVIVGEPDCLSLQIRLGQA